MYQKHSCYTYRSNKYLIQCAAVCASIIYGLVSIRVPRWLLGSISSGKYTWYSLKCAGWTLYICLVCVTRPSPHGFYEPCWEACSGSHGCSAMNLFTDLITTKTGPLYCGGRFSPLSREQLTRALRMLLQLAGYDQHSYASHSFRIGAYWAS